jgi:uroporphyrinogen-III synthase
MNNNISILSTATLDREFVSIAAKRGVELDVIPFIKVSAIESEELAEKIVDMCYIPASVVFTSANAVKAVSDVIMAAEPQWDIYCIGNATLKAVNKVLPSATVIAVADNAAELADIIVEDGEDEIVFFCGDQRLDTLPRKLRENDITVYELVVYRTETTPIAVSKEYSGILLFSPSAVNSFFSSNKLSVGTVLFAIGATTADAIKKQTNNKIVFSETATKESVLEYAMKYFQK